MFFSKSHLIWMRPEDGILRGQLPENYLVSTGTNDDITPNGGLVREISFFQKNRGWRNIIICPSIMRCGRAILLTQLL